jgi:hypothetical protein
MAGKKEFSAVVVKGGSQASSTPTITSARPNFPHKKTLTSRPPEAPSIPHIGGASRCCPRKEGSRIEILPGEFGWSIPTDTRATTGPTSIPKHATGAGAPALPMGKSTTPETTTKRGWLL